MEEVANTKPTLGWPNSCGACYNCKHCVRITNDMMRIGIEPERNMMLSKWVIPEYAYACSKCNNMDVWQLFYLGECVYWDKKDFQAAYFPIPIENPGIREEKQYGEERIRVGFTAYDVAAVCDGINDDDALRLMHDDTFTAAVEDAMVEFAIAKVKEEVAKRKG